MLDWIDAKARLWGLAKRKLLHAKEAFPESPSGRLVEEGAGAGQAGKNSERFPEVFTGDALEIALAVHRGLESGDLTPRQYEIFYSHYVIKAPVKVKQHRLNVSHARYYQLLGAGQNNIAQFITTAT